VAPSPSSSVQRAREQLAARLREIRLDAGLSAQDLSAAAGWHKAKTSRIESAKQAPSEADIAAWCRVCGAAREVPDLIAASRAADSMYVEWRRLNRGGLRHIQEAVSPLFAARRIRCYCPAVIPGFVQTPAYAAALLSSIAGFREIPDDSQDAAAARANRGRLVLDGTRHVSLVVEEEVLRHRIAPPDVMATQLAYLLEAAALPGVSLGVIPFTADRPAWPLEAFTIFGDDRVRIELLSAQVTVTTPGEVTLYARAFERLGRLAVRDGAARSLVDDAVKALG
jgi:transcriptional regulator with XRE-family HTH domain